MKAKVHVVDVFATVLPDWTDTADTAVPDAEMVVGAELAATGVVSTLVASVYWLVENVCGAGGLVRGKVKTPWVLAPSEQPVGRVTTSDPDPADPVAVVQPAKPVEKVIVGLAATMKAVG